MESIVALGLDQGIANCGYAIVKFTPPNDIKILCSGTFKTKSTNPTTQRILYLQKEINQIIEIYNPHIIGCEKLFFNQAIHTNGEKVRNKSASILTTSMVTGIVFLLAGLVRIPCLEFVPGTVKKIVTGNGRADKSKVEEAVLKSLHPNGTAPKTSHESDAIAIGITTAKYFAQNKERVLDESKHIIQRPRKGASKKNEAK